MFFGGSVLGARAKLPYIRALGFDGVLVGPFLANQPAAYHGYHAIDNDHVDPRFFGVDGDGRDVLVQRENVYTFLLSFFLSFFFFFFFFPFF